MPWFRASRRVEGPSGQIWEIYVTRGVSPAWKPADLDAPLDTDYAISGGGWLLALAFELPFFLLTNVLWPIVRVVLTLPWTVVRALRARDRTVEAVAFTPHASYAWRTAPGDVRRVVDEIAAGLAQGLVARPEGAVFLGERTSNQ